jgi:hypothetical protein
MLHVQNVEGFEWIYIHVGNSHHNTSGCLLVGHTCNEDSYTIGNSRAAYSDLYQAVVEAAKDDDLTIEYIDGDLEDG